MANTILGPMGVMSGPADEQRNNPSDPAPVKMDVGAIAQKYRLPRNVLMALEEQGEDPEVKAAEISRALRDGKALEDVVPYASLVRASDIADEIEGVEPQGGLGAAFGAGIDSLQQAYGSAAEGVGRSLGIDSLAEYGAEVAENNAAEARSKSRGFTGLSDVDGVGSGASYVGETVAQQVPQFATSVGPVAAGAAIGSMVAPGPGTLAGGAIGGAAALAANIAQFYGFNRERQKEENDGEVNEAAAFGTAIPQATIDVASDALILAPLGLGPKALQAGNRARRIMTGAGLGAVSEAPTEAAQQAMERAQAGLELTGDDARKEYIESAVAGGLVGGIFGGGRGALSRSRDEEPTDEVDRDAPEAPLGLPAPALVTPPPESAADTDTDDGLFGATTDPYGDGSATGENAGALGGSSPAEAPAFYEIPAGAQIDAEGLGESGWNVPAPDLDISTGEERVDMIRTGLDKMLRATGLAGTFDQTEYFETLNYLDQNGGDIEDAIWSQLRRSAERAEQPDWTDTEADEGTGSAAVEPAYAGGLGQPAIDRAPEAPSAEGVEGRDRADAGQAEVIDAAGVAETAVPEADPTPTIENIRTKAAVLRGVPKDEAPDVGNISLKWDEKEGGFIFSRKHTDKVKAALDRKAEPEAATSPYDPQYEGNEEVSKAKGQADFAAGKPRRMPREIDPSDAVAADAWYRGWDEANLAAPVGEAPVAKAAEETASDPTPAQAESNDDFDRDMTDQMISVRADIRAKKPVTVTGSKVTIGKNTITTSEYQTQLNRVESEQAHNDAMKSAIKDKLSDNDGAPDTEIVTVKDAYGDTHRVRKSDLEGSKPMLRRYKANGDPVDDGIPLNRENIDTDGSKVTATYADQNVIGAKGSDKPLKNKASVTKAIQDRGQNVDDFEIRQVDGGFLGVRKSALKDEAKPNVEKPQKPAAKAKPKLSSDADRPMPDLSQIDYEEFDDKTREDGQNSPGKRKGRSEMGRWARAVVKALKEAGFTETLNAKGKPQKAVSFGYSMSHEPDETNIYLTAPNGVDLYVSMRPSINKGEALTILVQFRGEPPKRGYSKPFLGENRFLDETLRPSEAAEKIIKWAAALDPKPKEVKKPEATEWKPTVENYPFADSEAGNPGPQARRWFEAASDDLLLNPKVNGYGLSDNWLRTELKRRKIGIYAPSDKAKKPAEASPAPKNWSAIDESSANDPKMPEGYEVTSFSRLTKQQAEERARPWPSVRAIVKTDSPLTYGTYEGWSDKSRAEAVQNALTKAQKAVAKRPGEKPAPAPKAEGWQSNEHLALFKRVYDSGNNSLEDMRNGIFPEVAEYADWLGELNDDALDKIAPVFRADYNPFHGATYLGNGGIKDAIAAFAEVGVERGQTNAEIEAEFAAADAQRAKDQAAATKIDMTIFDTEAGFTVDGAMAVLRQQNGEATYTYRATSFWDDASKSWKVRAKRSTNLNQGPTGSTNPPTKQLGTFKNADLALDAMEKDGLKPQPKPTKKPQQSEKPAAGLLSGLSAEKQARAAELKAKLAAKVRNQTSSGLDPEYITLGGELVALYIEGGAKKFGQMLRDFAETTGLSMREAQAPMRAAYNHVRDDMDLAGQDVSDMDDAATVMAEVRAALKEEDEASQNSAADPILEGEPANEGQDGTDTQQQDPRLDNPSVGGAEPGQGSDTGGSQRSDERGDGGSSARDGEPSGVGDNLAGGMVGDGVGSAGDQAAERRGVNPGNFVIPDDFNLGAGTPGQKIDANIAAIRLVKTLQAENRHPTKAEQETLARYVGWGGLKRVFDPKEEGKTSQWGRAQADLRDLLTPDQYRAAAYSTAHAHYTSADVVGAMWGAMRGFGFDGGRALEPTVGTGNFVGMQPQDLAEKTEWYAAELDDITGAIAEYLYPDATVFAGQGFENAPFRAGSIDVAIGNPPFGSEILKSDMHPDIPPLSVHNYIIAKTGLLLRPGGIMGMVVTSRFLDTPNPGARSYLSKHFNFMGAVRLPNTAFKANAGTEVTTDIVWFQKRRDGDAKGDQSWLQTGVERDGIPMNGYFAANPDMMLGSPSMKGTMYGPDPEFTLDDDGRDLPSAMREAMGKIEGQLPSRETQLEDAVVAAKTTSDLGIGESLLTDDDKVMMRLDDDRNGNAVVVELNAKSPWGPITHELMSASEAIEAAGQAIKNESVEVAEDAVKAALDAIGDTQSLTDKGTMKKSAPTGMGKEALNALTTLHEGLSDENPYFGPAQKKALTALKKAVDAKRIGPKKFEALKGMLSLRRDTLALLAAEMRNDPKMEAMRKALRRQYRAFVKKHGYVNDPANDALVNGLPGAESALETRHRKANKAQGIEASAEEAAILSKRINTPYEPATKADSALDGIHISLRERGRLDMGLIADLTGKPMPEVIEELTGGEKPHVFYDPKRAEYVIADEYLSGNLADKIKEAQDYGSPENIPHLEAAMPEDKTAEQIVPSIRSMWMPGEVFADFLRELGALKPKVNIDMKSANVDVEAAGTPSDFGQMFQTERMNPFQIFTYAARGKSIVIYDRTHDNKQVKNEKATQDANAAAERMAEEFKKWAYMNAERKAAIVDAFNEKMNVVVPRNYDGVSYLTQVGANPEIELRNSQKNGAWRMMLSQSTLLHHVVGAGKTFTAITAIMERKRLGLSKKTLVAVPNHIVGQWARDFYALYPGANILAATEKDFTKANRRKLIARIATGDFDAVIVGHSSLRHIQNNVEETEALMQEQLGDLEYALAEAKRQGTSGRNVSQIAGRIKKYKEKMKAELAKLKGDQMGFDFTAMGVDNLVIDEAHEFKNLEYSTAADRLVGMNSPDGSQRALDLYIKTRGLMARKGSVGFLTGTPVSNSLVEIYTVMKYLAPETLRSMNLMQYDAWASTFVQSKIRFEYTASQKLKERNVLAGLNNLGPLSDIYRSFADIVMRKEVEAMYKEQMEAENKKNGTNKPTRFPTPKVKNGGRQLVSLPSSPDQDEFTDYLVMRMGGIQANKSDKEYMKKDNALWVLSDARKASIDIRTVDPEAQRHEHSKVVAVGRDTLRLAKATEKDRGTQLIFADSSVPTKTAAGSVKAAIKAAWGKAGLSGPEATERMKKDAEAGKPWSEQWGDVVEAIETRMESGDLTEKQQEAIEEWMNGDDSADGAAAAFTADSGFSFYDDLKAYLVENGMAPEEIAFIHDYPKGDQKAGLFEAVNEGKVRVLIGSTFKMGAGTNAQERMVGLRHVDAPWRPSDMEQREGRIIRQGNKLYKADPEGFEVEITAYTTEKTSDVVLWQVLERKAAGIEQFLDANADTITEEDDSDADSYASFMAQSTGNPVFLRKMETEKAVRDKESEQSSMRMVVSEAKSFLGSYDGRMKHEKRTIAAMDKVTFDAYPDAGASWTQYKTDMRAYEQAKEAHEAGVDKVREANKKLAKGEKRQKLPEFEQKPPQMFEGKLDAYSKRVRDAIREAIDKGESSKIKIGGGSLQVIRNDTKMEGVYSYFAEFEVEGQDYIIGVMKTGAVAKNPFNSRTLISAMMPDSVREAVRVNKRRSERQIERMEEAKPDMERKAKIQIDRTELNNLKRDLEMFKGMVRVAEVRNAQNRLGKTNRFAAMDDKGRSLELDKSDDAPLMPEGGASEFVFQNAGQTYRAAMGAKGGTFTKDGATTSIYWFEATDDDGNPALVQASQTTENQSSKDKKDGEAPKPAPLEVLNVFDTSQVEGAAELRGSGTDLAVTEGDVRALTRDMNAELAQSGLAGKVSVRVVKRLVSLTSGNEILGRFEADKGITVRAAGGVDERGIMRHEIIHALRSPKLWNTSHGLFTPAEWRGLVRAARADKGIRDNVLGRYADQPAAMQSEEMVAEMYRLWAANRDSYSGVETVLAKIEAFLGALANLLRGRGFNSAAMTMQRIASGQVGGRGATSPIGYRSATVPMQGAEMRAPAGAVREKFKGLVGSDHWKDPQGFISNKLSDAMAGKGDYSLLALVPGRPLFAELGKRLTAAQSYLKHKENMDQTRNDWHSRADTLSQRWLKARNKDPRANDTLMDLMHRTTLAQVDPTQAYDGSDATWAKKEVARHGEHAPDWAHRKVAEDQRRRKSHRVLRDIYDGLPPAFQKLYKDIRAEYDAMGDDFEDAVVENVKHSMRVALKRARKEHKKAMQSIKDDGLTGREKADAVAEADEALRKAEQRNEKGAASKLQSLRAQFESNRLTGPYFPLARFGDYFVTVRDDDDQVISFAQFETEAKQQVHIKEMEAKHPGKVQHGLMNKKGALRDQVNPTFVADVEAMLADAEVDNQVLDAIWQRWLSTMPDQSIRTSKIHRKGRAGWNEDAFRAFGKHMFHGAHQLARLKHGVLLEEALDDARDEARVSENPNRAGALVNEMEKRHEFTMNPEGSSVVASMSSLAFLWYLGASPAAALVNISQTTIVGTPIMAARFTKAGVNGSLSAITKAAKDFGRGKGHVENSANLSADEKKAMAEAYQRGTIDKTQAHDLASVAETGIEYNAHREKWMRRIGWFFHNAERMNREVTFLANYRLARADGLSHAEAVDVGADMTWKIHFSYQNTDRPRFMQNDLGKILTTFRQFTVNMLYRMFRDAHQALNGATEAERREARAQLIGITLSMMAHAGIKGTWGYGIAMGLLALFLPGDSDDLEDWMQDALLMEGDDPATAAWNFAMGAALNGVPGQITGANLTERLGMPNLWFRGPGRDLEGRDVYAHYVKELLGPVYGIGEGVVRGGFAVAEGEVVRGAESMVPKFIRDIVKTGRYATDGVETWNGDPIVEDVNPWELLLQANGFTPARVAERYEINNRLKNRERRIMDERKDIHKAASDAIASGGPIPEKVMDMVRDFNKRYPEYPITGQTIKQSFRGRQRASLRNEFGIALNPRLNSRLRSEVTQPVYN